MTVDVHDLKIDSDERGFELHLWLDDWPVCNEDGRISLNIHSCAEQLHAEVVKQIGPWVAEGLAAKAEYDRAGGHPMCPDEDGRCIYGRDETCPRIDEYGAGWMEKSHEAMRDAADLARKREKGE